MKKNGRVAVKTKDRTVVTVRLLPRHADYLDRCLVGERYMDRQSAIEYLFDQVIARDTKFKQALTA